MLDFLGDALGAIMSGGLTGIIGSGISIFGKIKMQKLTNNHEVAMGKLKQDDMRLQMEIITEQTKAAINVSEMQAFTESQRNDSASYSKGQELSGGQKWLMVVVDFLRGMIRPSMTIYMTVLTTMIYVKLMDMLGGLEDVIDTATALGMVNQVILVILYITTTTILWWFGTRQKIISQPK